MWPSFPYNRHWNERLGQVIWFEAMPGTRDAVRLLMDAACDWLKGQGAECQVVAARPWPDTKNLFRQKRADAKHRVARAVRAVVIALAP